MEPKPKSLPDFYTKLDKTSMVAETTPTMQTGEGTDTA
jgi:hypothetical protein